MSDDFKAKVPGLETFSNYETTFRFWNGETVQYSLAEKFAWDGTVEIWSADDGIKEFKTSVFGHLSGFHIKHYHINDLGHSIYKLSRNKLNICQSHCNAAIKIGAGKTKNAIIVDSDSFGMFKQKMKLKNVRFGICVNSVTQCNEFGSECKIESFYSAKKVKSIKNEEEKKDSTPTSKKGKKTTFISSKRKGFAARCGFEDEKIVAIENDGDLIAKAMLKVCTNHPVLKDYPALQMEYALMIYDNTASISRMPPKIRQQVCAAAARKRKYNNLLGGMNIMPAIHGLKNEDFDELAHEQPMKKKRKIRADEIDEGTLEMLKAKWEKERVEKKENKD